MRKVRANQLCYNTNSRFPNEVTHHDLKDHGTDAGTKNKRSNLPNLVSARDQVQVQGKQPKNQDRIECVDEDSSLEGSWCWEEDHYESPFYAFEQNNMAAMKTARDEAKGPRVSFKDPIYSEDGSSSLDRSSDVENLVTSLSIFSLAGARDSPEMERKEAPMKIANIEECDPEEEEEDIDEYEDRYPMSSWGYSSNEDELSPQAKHHNDSPNSCIEEAMNNTGQYQEGVFKAGKKGQISAGDLRNTVVPLTKDYSYNTNGADSVAKASFGSGMGNGNSDFDFHGMADSYKDGNGDDGNMEGDCDDNQNCKDNDNDDDDVDDNDGGGDGDDGGSGDAGDNGDDKVRFGFIIEGKGNDRRFYYHRSVSNPNEHIPWGDYDVLKGRNSGRSRILVDLPGNRLLRQEAEKREENYKSIEGSSNKEKTNYYKSVCGELRVFCDWNFWQEYTQDDETWWTKIEDPKQIRDLVAGRFRNLNKKDGRKQGKSRHLDTNMDDSNKSAIFSVGDIEPFPLASNPQVSDNDYFTKCNTNNEVGNCGENEMMNSFLMKTSVESDEIVGNNSMEMNSGYFSASMMAERNWMDMPMRRNTMKSMNEFSPVMEVDSNKTQGKSTTMSIDDDCLDNSIKSLDAPEVFEDANTRRKIYTQPSQHSLLSEISGSTCVGLSQPNTQSANDSFTININMDSKIDGGTKNMRENEMIKNRWTEPTFDLPLKKPMNRSVYMNATKTKCIDDTDSINTTSSVSKKRHIEFEDGNIYPSLEYDSTTVRRSPVYDRTFNLMPGSSGERYKNPTDWSVGGRHNMADTFSTMNMNEESSSGRTSRSNYSTRSYYSNPNSGNYSGNSRNKKEWNSGQEDVVDYSIGGNCQGAPTNQQDDLGHAKLKWSPATGRVAIKLVKNGAVHLNKPFNLEQIKSGQEKGHILVLDDEIEVKIFDDEGHLFCISDLRDIQIGCIIEMKGTRYKVSENTTPGRINSTVVVVPKKKIRCL